VCSACIPGSYSVSAGVRVVKPKEADWGHESRRSRARSAPSALAPGRKHSNPMRSMLWRAAAHGAAPAGPLQHAGAAPYQSPTQITCCRSWPSAIRMQRKNQGVKRAVMLMGGSIINKPRPPERLHVKHVWFFFHDCLDENRLNRLILCKWNGQKRRIESRVPEFEPVAGQYSRTRLELQSPVQIAGL
jgi:hypothetical protein